MLLYQESCKIMLHFSRMLYGICRPTLEIRLHCIINLRRVLYTFAIIATLMGGGVLYNITTIRRVLKYSYFKRGAITMLLERMCYTVAIYIYEAPKIICVLKRVQYNIATLGIVLYNIATLMMMLYNIVIFRIVIILFCIVLFF